MYTKLLIAGCIAITLTASSAPYDYVLPPQNYRHWTILKEVCEKKETYGTNEYVKDGKVCRWKHVPYYPYDNPPSPAPETKK
jgi:hypothetical protein